MHPSDVADYATSVGPPGRQVARYHLQLVTVQFYDTLLLYCDDVV